MRYTITCVTVTILTIIKCLFAQAPDTMWTKTFKWGWGNGHSIQQTSDGGFIITGQMSSDLFLIKTDFKGDTAWTKTYDGDSHYVDIGYSVSQTADGGYVMTGVTNRRPGNPGGTSGGKVWLLKTNAEGDTVWTKRYGISPPNSSLNVWGNSIQQTTDGGYIVAGVRGRHRNEHAWHSGNIWLIKTDTNGDTLWTKTFSTDGCCFGVIADVEFLALQTTDDGFIITGHNLLIKTDSNGNTEWTKMYEESIVNSVQQTPDGGYIIAGSSVDYNNWNDDGIWLAKTDAGGDTLWTKTYRESMQLDFGNSIQQTKDNGYIILSMKNAGDWLAGDVLLIKTDYNGDSLWTKDFGNGSLQYGNDLQQTIDGGFIITGSIFEGGGQRIWLVKVAPDVTTIDKDPQAMVSNYELKQNYPNPFNPSTTIEFNLPKTSEVSLKVYNILGEEVTTLVSDRLSTGSYSYEWDAGNLASGVYLYRLSVGSLMGEAGEFVETRKMVLMR